MVPESRSERLLAKINGEDVELPIPQSRIEMYLHKLASDGIPVSVVSDTEPVSGTITLTLQPCPVTYDFGEIGELDLTIPDGSQYHFAFTCPSGAATVLTMTGIEGTSGDSLEAGKYYEVDIWNGVALTVAVEVTAV